MIARPGRLSWVAVLILMGLLFVSGPPHNAVAQDVSADNSDLLYSTYLGGEDADGASAIAVDADGNEYIAGSTCSPDFLSARFVRESTLPCTTFVAKFDSSNALVYVTELGGDDGLDAPDALAVDRRGNVYVAGITSSVEFPSTPGAFDRTLNGRSDAFVLKLDESGNLVYSTFLGGSYSDSSADGEDWARGIAVNEQGQVFVTGITRSFDFPTSANAYDKSYSGGDGNDAFLVRLNENGSELLYGTFLGRQAWDFGTGIALDPAGDIIVTGNTASPLFPTTEGAFQTEFRGNNCEGYPCFDIFIAKFSAITGALVFSTLVGGGKSDESNAIMVDATGAIYLTGETESRNFPVTPGAFDTTFNDTGIHPGDAFVLKLTPDGSRLEYSTFLGGKSYEAGLGIAVDKKGAAHVVGYTTSNNFPTTRGAFDRKCNKPCEYALDAFFVKLNPRGTQLRYGTFIGGRGNTGSVEMRANPGLATTFEVAHADPGHESALGIAVDANGIAHIAGITKSTDLPTTPDAYDTTLSGYADAFL